MLSLLSVSRNAAVFIAVIALLRLLLKRCLPRTAFVVLWLAAALRMLCPFRLPSAVSFWRLFAKTPGADPEGVVRFRRLLAPAGAAPARDALPNSGDFFGRLWLLGVAAVLVGFAFLYLRAVRDAKSAEPLGNGTYLCRKISSPRLCGIFRPRILLPEGVGDELLPFILLHERVHMRRLDNLWKLLALAAAAVHWFNPAAWALVALLGRDLEVSCDEWVLRKLDSDGRRAYALSLITMAEHPQGRSPMTCGFCHNPLEERIRMIMTSRKKSMLALSAATAMILCTTSAFATDAPDGAAPALREYEVTTPEAASTVDSGSADTECGVILFTDQENWDDVTVSVRNGAGDVVVTGVTDLEFYTADEYAVYLEEQKLALLEEVRLGELSQETYDGTIQEMEEALEGLRNGAVMVAKPFTNEDGSEVSIVVETAETEEYEVNCFTEEDGSLSAVIGDKAYSVIYSDTDAE